jgi:hypothetical protein
LLPKNAASFPPYFLTNLEISIPADMYSLEKSIFAERIVNDDPDLKVLRT